MAVVPEQIAGASQLAPPIPTAVAVSRGRNFDYWSGVIFPNQSITVLTVPIGAAFYLDYLYLGCFSPIPDGTVFYVALDGKPVLMASHTSPTAQMVLPRPILFKYTMTTGPLGGQAGWPSMSQMITFAGDVHA